MSDKSEGNENIETAQRNQKKIGAAKVDAKTTGPAGNLKEETAEMIDKDVIQVSHPTIRFFRILFELLALCNKWAILANMA
jgi:hypothetical protein